MGFVGDRAGSSRGNSCSTTPIQESGPGRSAEEPLWKDSPHHVSVFPSVTRTTDGGGDDAFTIGLDYEYRVSQLLGLGLVAEYADEPIEATTILGVADLHLWRGLALQTGPGVVLEQEGDPNFAFRFGVLYEFEFEYGLTLSPQVHYDLISGTEDELVYGLAFGVAF